MAIKINKRKTHSSTPTLPLCAQTLLPALQSELAAKEAELAQAQGMAAEHASLQRHAASLQAAIEEREGALAALTASQEEQQVGAGGSWKL